MIDFRAMASSSKGNCYTLSDSHTEIMIECGISVKAIKKRLDFKLSSIDACLVSHEHKDHCYAAKDIMDDGVDVYTGKPTIKTLGLEGHRVNVVEPNILFKIGTFTIKALPVVHDVPNLAFLIASGRNKILFMIDTPYCPYMFSGLTHIAIGINYDMDILRYNIERGYLHPGLGKRIIENHMSLQTSLGFFREQGMNKVEEIHVLHCSEGNMDKAKAKRAIQKVTGKMVLS